MVQHNPRYLHVLVVCLCSLHYDLRRISIQRLNDSGATHDSPLHSANISEAGGTKVTLSYLWRRLAGSGVDVGALWARICSVVVKSLVCVEGSIPHQPNR